jgi:hypothetical protein
MNKQFDYITLPELMASVKGILKSFYDDGLIDDTRAVSKVMWCNDKLGIPIRQVKEDVLFVRNYTTEIPKDFQKVVYVCALSHTSFGLANYIDPFNNFVDLNAPCAVEMTPFEEGGCKTGCRQNIRRKKGDGLWQTYTNWTELNISKNSTVFTASGCINNKKRGEYTIDITEGKIDTPFREAELYLMYYANMEDEEGNILLPFHPLITPWYEWAVAEQIILDSVLNSENPGILGQKLQLVQNEARKAWLDAFNFTMDPVYRQMQDYTRKKETEMWRKYFRNIQ